MTPSKISKVVRHEPTDENILSNMPQNYCSFIGCQEEHGLIKCADCKVTLCANHTLQKVLDLGTIGNRKATLNNDELKKEVQLNFQNLHKLYESSKDLTFQCLKCCKVGQEKCDVYFFFEFFVRIYLSRS